MANETDNNGLMTRDEFLKYPDAEFTVHTIESAGPYQGKKIRLRTMTAKARQELMLRANRWMEQGGDFDQISEVLVHSAVDAEGKPLFSVADVAALGQRNGVVMQELLDVCMRHNGLKKGQIEAMQKKSESPSASSS